MKPLSADLQNGLAVFYLLCAVLNVGFAAYYLRRKDMLKVLVLGRRRGCSSSFMPALLRLHAAGSFFVLQVSGQLGVHRHQGQRPLRQRFHRRLSSFC